MLDYIIKKISYKREERKRIKQDRKKYMTRWCPAECKNCKYVRLSYDYNIWCKIKNTIVYNGFKYNEFIIEDCKYFKQKEQNK